MSTTPTLFASSSSSSSSFCLSFATVSALTFTTISSTSSSYSSHALPPQLLNSWRPYSPNHQYAAFSSPHCNNRAITLKLLSLSSKTTWKNCRTLAALPFDLSPPPIDHDLLDTVATEGAEVSEDGIVETFGNDDEALEAVHTGVVVVDLSHFGRIRVSGDDRIQFLHNQSTANFECLRDGQA